MTIGRYIEHRMSVGRYLKGEMKIGRYIYSRYIHIGRNDNR